MIHEYLELSPFRFITIIVQAQLAITLAMSGVIAVMLVRRTRLERWALALHTVYSETLVTEMLDALEPESNAGQMLRPRSRAERRVLKGALLEHLKTLSGSERDFMIKRYEDLGFVKSDLRQLRSVFWWRRLSAASDLSLLEMKRFATEFYRISGDSNELVSAFGHYALSGLKHDINRPFPVRSFPKSVQVRRNLMTEILRNWAKVRGPVALTDQIPRVEDPVLLEALVTAASSTLSTATAEAFAEHLISGQLFTPMVLERMITCLTKVGDPGYAEAVRPYVAHENEIVRLRSLEYFVAMGEDEVLERADVRGDQSSIVRRAITRWQVERGAA